VQRNILLTYFVSFVSQHARRDRVWKVSRQRVASRALSARVHEALSKWRCVAYVSLLKDAKVSLVYLHLSTCVGRAGGVCLSSSSPLLAPTI